MREKVEKEKIKEEKKLSKELNQIDLGIQELENNLLEENIRANLAKVAKAELAEQIKADGSYLSPRSDARSRAALYYSRQDQD